MKSKRGIYYDLNESDYIYNIDNFKFVFSSLFYLNLFKQNLEAYLKYEESKLNSKIGECLNLKEVILLNHYKKLEKRGFLVYYNNKKLDKYKFIVNLEME